MKNTIVENYKDCCKRNNYLTKCINRNRYAVMYYVKQHFSVKVSHTTLSGSDWIKTIFLGKTVDLKIRNLMRKRLFQNYFDFSKKKTSNTFSQVCIHNIFI